MGLRLRKALRILPGVRINLSKSGASLSVGGKGLTMNIGRKGVRKTVGLPGSGVSYSSYEKHSGKPLAIMWTLILLAACFAVYYLRNQ